MAVDIVRGGTCRISFYPRNGLDVTRLGSPAIAVLQELTVLFPEPVVDADRNRVYADLTEEDTMQLVEGVRTQAQLAFTNDETEEVFRFPIHELTVSASLFGQFYEPEEEPVLEDIPHEEGMV